MVTENNLGVETRTESVVEVSTELARFSSPSDILKRDIAKKILDEPDRFWCVQDFVSICKKRKARKLLNELVSVGFLRKILSYPRFYQIK